MRKCKIQASLVCLLAVVVPVLATYGGYQDPQTGLVWSGPYSQRVGSYTGFDNAVQAAADYSVLDDGIVYDDWRLPTIPEVQAAIANGTIGQVWLGEPNSMVAVWAIEGKGGGKPKGGPWFAYVVEVEFDAQGNVVGGGEVVKVTRNSVMDALFVRP